MKRLLSFFPGLFLLLLAIPQVFAIAGPDQPAGVPSITKLGGTGGLLDLVTKFGTGIIVAVATLFLIVGAFFYITAHGEEEQIKKGKSIIIYSLVGLAVAALASVLIKIFYQPTTGIPSATEANALITSLVTFAQSLAMGLAVLFLVIAGYFYITARGEEEQLKKAKTMVIYSIVGMMVVVLSSSIVGIFGPTQIKTSQGLLLIASLTKFALSFVGSIALIMLIYGGFLYITAQGEEDQMGKAKKLIIGAIIGILIIVFSYTIITLVASGGTISTPAPIPNS